MCNQINQYVLRKESKTYRDTHKKKTHKEVNSGKRHILLKGENNFPFTLILLAASKVKWHRNARWFFRTENPEGQKEKEQQRL